jgi:hypothetical protein
LLLFSDNFDGTRNSMHNPTIISNRSHARFCTVTNIDVNVRKRGMSLYLNPQYQEKVITNKTQDKEENMGIDVLDEL